MNETLLQSLYDLTDLIARKSIAERFHFIQESGLSHSQMMSLFFLQRNQLASMKDLADHLGVSSPAVSQLVEKLVRSDLVKRIDNPNDRRGKLLELTKNGNAMVSQAKIAHHQWIQAITETIQPEEVPLVEKSIQILLSKQSLLQTTKNKSYRKGDI